MRPITLLLLLLSPCVLFGDEHHGHPTAADLSQLGKVHFETSCSTAVQPAIDRGVALLHSFWYEEAEKQFNQVIAADKKCGIAYWGDTMSLWHQLWDRPSKNDLRRGADLLRKGAKARENSDRERAYIAALQRFFADPKLDHDKRAAQYSDAMERVYRAYPDDTEAAAFYALSLLASSDPHGLSSEKKAIPILQALFDKQPDHPGIAHYLIHACDSPELASEGLPAARRYAQIAPGSAHAVHMPSHIFARLGLWDEDIKSNLASVAATERATAMHMGGDAHKLHAMDFLEYAYLQIGEDAKAKEIVDRVAAMHDVDAHDALHGYLAGAQVDFPSKYLIETRDWKGAMAVRAPEGSKPNVALGAAATHAIAAGHLHDAAAAKQALAEYEKSLHELEHSPDAYMAKFFDNEHDEVRAFAAYAQGNGDEAVRLLRSIADDQDKTGKGETALPAREMAADLLLDMNKPQAALAEYQLSMKTDPNRFNGLYGAAQAAERIGNAQLASTYYAQLVKNCAGSSTPRPELARARTITVAAQ